jgi:preprotein translocase subunit SecE
MAKFNPGEFVRQVRQEASKVTWPNRKEVGVTTAMVFIAVTLAAIFFLLVDLAANRAIGFILGVLG